MRARLEPCLDVRRPHPEQDQQYYHEHIKHQAKEAFSPRTKRQHLSYSTYQVINRRHMVYGAENLGRCDLPGGRVGDQRRNLRKVHKRYAQ
jgi:hypothetical protein